jgi:hypothetical protein
MPLPLAMMLLLLMMLMMMMTMTPDSVEGVAAVVTSQKTTFRVAA